jgi:hypothetical protein
MKTEHGMPMKQMMYGMPPKAMKPKKPRFSSQIGTAATDGPSYTPKRNSRRVGPGTYAK